MDAVTEAKVALQNYDAEFGKAVSSVVTAQTKSGSNELHGSGFYFRRSDAQQARDPFTQSPNQANPVTGRLIPPSRWQQFGFTLGGPIIKDKLFFFGDYQGTRQTNGVSGLFTIPTERVRSSCNPATNATSATPDFCDLSDYSDPANGITGGGQSFDPATGDYRGSGRTPFAGNLIPIDRISPAAAAILAALPAPQNSNVLNNFVGSGSGPFSQNGFDTRIDYSATSSINVFGRFSLNYYSLSGQGVFGQMQGPGNGLFGLSGSSITHNYSLATGFTKTFSATLLTDFRFGYFKYNPVTAKPDGGTPMSDFGIPNANTEDPKTEGLGSFQLGKDAISGYNGSAANGDQGLVISSFGDGLGVARCNCPLTESEQQFQFVNNWTKILGNHQVKFGADIRYAMNLRIPSDNNRTGEYNFSPQVTAQEGNGGLDLATFLLGQVSSFARYVNNPDLPSANNAAERQKRWFFYGQDTWRVTPKLTLNYGLRWEIYFPETVNAKGNGGFANIVDLDGVGAIRVAGFGDIGSNGNVDNKLNAFAPRLGIAYQLTPKTVIRAGYGRSFDIGVFGSNFGHTVTQNLPVLLKQNLNASNLPVPGSGDRVPLFALDDGPIPPVFPAVPDNGIIPFNDEELGGQISGVHIRPPDQVLPTVDAWNVTVQHQITNTLSLEAAYVGSKGTHGFAGNGPNYNVNPVGHLELFHAINPLTGVEYTQNQRRPLCGPLDTTPGPTLGNCTKIPFSLDNYYGNDAASTYKALELKVDKRFSGGLQLMSHYTYSRAYNHDSNYYAINHDISWGPVDFNRDHVWVLNTVYELPFGKGKRFAGGAGTVMDYIIGGWQVSNTTNWSSGLPWTPSFSKCGAEQDVGICRPNKGNGSFDVGVSGSIDPITHTLTYYTPVPDITTTPGPFEDPSFQNLGNVGRNTFHGPSGFYSDLSVVKKFKIYEKLTAQFRMDAFNLFNHPVYAFSSNNGAQTCIDCQGGNNGKITGLEGGTSMRQLQFAVRFDF